MSETRFFLRSKSAQLTEYLRTSFLSGQLADPLPGIRLWSQQLGVSRRTLSDAVKALRVEGWITVDRRGIRLNARARRRPGSRSAVCRRVRILLYGQGMPRIADFQILLSLQARLASQSVEVTRERCSPPKLREIIAHRAGLDELLILASVPPIFHQLSARHHKPVIVLGNVAPRWGLPSVCADQPGGIRHATFRLLQHGHRQIILVCLENGIRFDHTFITAPFTDACAGWPKQPVVAKIVSTALDQSSLTIAARRVAQAVTGRCGIIVVAPIPIGLIVTELWRQRIPVPSQAEVAALFHPDESVMLSPPPIHYPFPTAAIVKHLASEVMHFFDTGHLPFVTVRVASDVATAG